MDDNVEGSAYYSKGEFDKVIEHYEKALEIRLATLGPQHPDTAFIFSDLGKAYYSKVESDKAIKHLKNLSLVPISSPAPQPTQQTSQEDYPRFFYPSLTLISLF